eukprot:CAMPEP_0178436050 /NCGR_PEP_ID=MMETSP0689_2-20121128/34242_1 /TAXON_ID=160604 /ORGANISM="Amphidinium massartii, Strain CS-259" /LENGTH=395 /DNA_ID=CAMNT_0020058139 /DNA_START=100 /DNA_END=1284 /DNA_ORIENTATION=+
MTQREVADVRAEKGRLSCPYHRLLKCWQTSLAAESIPSNNSKETLQVEQESPKKSELLAASCQREERVSSWSSRCGSGEIYVIGLALSLGLTAVIAITASSLQNFSVVGRSPTQALGYPWQLRNPTFMSHLTAWLGYACHNIGAWLIIAAVRRKKPKVEDKMRWFNWATLVLHLLGFALHWMQSQLWFDGLAADVPEVTALGSVALMLMVVLLLENPRRGLILGVRMHFRARFMMIVREYHGYLFTWALIYTFWYHPMVGTPGHLVGFFYMFMLLGQSVLLYHSAHLNKWWTLTLELLVLPHGVLVAVFQGKQLTPMFAFGFGAMFLLTQMYGLGLGRSTRIVMHFLFIVVTVGTYCWCGRLPKIHEVFRIPVLDYAVIGLLYMMFVLCDSLFAG